MFMAAILNQVVTMTTTPPPDHDNNINCSNKSLNELSDHLPNADNFISLSSQSSSSEFFTSNQSSASTSEFFSSNQSSASSEFSSRLLHTRLFFRRRSISLTSMQDLAGFASSGSELNGSTSTLVSAMASSRPPRKTTVDHSSNNQTPQVGLRKKSLRDRDATPLAQDRDRQSISSMIIHDPEYELSDHDHMNETVIEIKRNNSNHQKSSVQVNRNDSGYNTDVGKRTPTPIRAASQKCRTLPAENSVKLTEQQHPQSAKSKLSSFGNLLRREKSSVSGFGIGTKSSGGPVQNRISQKIKNCTTSSSTASGASASSSSVMLDKGQHHQAAATNTKEFSSSKSKTPTRRTSAASSSHASSAVKKSSSDSKREHFVQTRSHTGLNLFGGRRRSIHITDDAYKLAMRSAKSHLDLTSEVIEEAKVTNTTTSVAAAAVAPTTTTTANSKKHFSERPWIELEKLWRSKAKDPPPDIESLIRNDINKRQAGGGGGNGFSGNGNGNGTLRKVPRPTSEQSHSKGYWPPPISNTTQVTSNPDAVKKVVDFLNPTVLDSYRHSTAIQTESNKHFTDLRSSW